MPHRVSVPAHTHWSSLNFTLEPESNQTWEPEMWKRTISTWLVAALGMIAASCAAEAVSPTAATDTRGTQVSALATPTSEQSLESEPAVQFASHVFVQPGTKLDVAAYGKFIGKVDITSPSSVSVSGSTVTADRGGISCLRFKYRDTESEGQIQTQCVVTFDETGNCDDHAPLALDLEQHAPAGLVPQGSNADLFESGDGTFYAACLTTAGKYRLQQPERQLPPLYLHIVDAYGQGPYSFGTSEFGLYRDSTVRTFSGGVLRPSMAHVMSAEINSLDFGPEGFSFEFDDCRFVPACSDDPDVLQPGDIISVTWSADLDRFNQIIEPSDTNGLEQWFTSVSGVDWAKVEQVHADLKHGAVVRLLNLEVMDAAIEMFDEMYAIREKQVTIAYTPFWPVKDVSGICFPEEEEQRLCREIESSLQAVEQERMQELKDAGYGLWLGGNADYDFEGKPRSWERELRPHRDNFDGYLLRVGANQHVAKDSVPGVLSEVMSSMAAELGGEKPVHLMVGGPPITAVTISEFCEADICTADFGPAYDQVEAWLGSALESFGEGQITGLSVALFDGSHFDILNPYETIAGVPLNRAAETGYNSPVLNIYRAQ